jgi:hypothetical protein
MSASGLPSFDITSSSIYPELSPMMPFAKPTPDLNNRGLQNSLGLSNWPQQDSTHFQTTPVPSHEMLFASQNPAYMQLYQRVMMLTKDREVTQAKFSTLE